MTASNGDDYYVLAAALLQSGMKVIAPNKPPTCYYADHKFCDDCAATEVATVSSVIVTAIGQVMVTVNSEEGGKKTFSCREGTRFNVKGG